MRLLSNVTFSTRYISAMQVDLNLGHYGNGRPALQVFDSETEEPITTLTVNLPEEDCGEDEIWIKDYSENEGVLPWLLSENLVEEEPMILHRNIEFLVKVKMSKRLIALIADALVLSGQRSRR